MEKASHITITIDCGSPIMIHDFCPEPQLLCVVRQKTERVVATESKV